MWKVTPPGTDQVEAELAAALTYKDGTPVHDMSLDEKARLFELYALYDAMKGTPCDELLSGDLSAELKVAIYDAYAQVQIGGRLAELRAQLLLAAPRCPLCGFGETKTLDHHLPRTDYKALAIYSRNLVPACGPCNRAKGIVSGATPDMQFHHAYLDELPQDIFFMAEVDLLPEPTGLVTRFSIAQCPGMLDDTYRRLKFQIERLKLNERYAAEINIYLGNLYPSLEAIYEQLGGTAKVREFLEGSIPSIVKSFGLNDWRPALLRALAQNEPFCAGGFKAVLGKLIPGA